MVVCQQSNVSESFNLGNRGGTRPCFLGVEFVVVIGDGRQDAKPAYLMHSFPWTWDILEIRADSLALL